jgi:hypothetical protein
VFPSPDARTPQSSPARSALSCHPPEERSLLRRVRCCRMPVVIG